MATFPASLILLLCTATVKVWGLDQTCETRTTCGDCIAASPQCAWCADQNVTGPRCYAQDTGSNCSLNGTQNPMGGILDQSQEPLSPTNQISPQRISISVRPGEEIVFGPLSVKPARNYPLDIYLLMDLSYSMLDNLQNLKMLGTQIASKIVNITTNYNLGFGSFVDKRLSPYISILPDLLKDPCASPYGVGGCVPTYSYKHAISLTSNSTEFNTKIQQQNISANVDPPEGGFDGILQAAVCQQLIKWRYPARHLLVFITDGPYHHAGDGKLGGVVTPHPGTCLMDQSNTDRVVEYVQDVKYDYPSIGQLTDKLALYDILPIFAVTSEVQDLYSDVASEMQSIGAQIATLARDSSNVVDLVSNTYSKISQQILFQPDLVPGVSIKLVPRNCPSIQPDGTCSGVQIEQQVQFDVHISLDNACTPELQNGPKEVNVRILGFGSFTVVVNAICRCPCEGAPKKSSGLCSGGNGTEVCGLCVCDQGRFGDQCQCDTKSAATTNSSTCDVGLNNLPCSGNTRGNCVCGKCQCSQFKDTRGNMRRYYGSKCECDDSSCKTSNGGLLCGGSAQGTCHCGVCQCKPGYSGAACECSDLLCINPADPKSQVCSGQGRCSCNTCASCKEPFTGRYCQSCMPTPRDTPNQCVNYYCSPNQACAKCVVGAAKGPQCNNCSGNISTVHSFNSYPDDSLANCQFTDNDCIYKFYVNSSLDVVVETTPSCNTLEPWFLAAVIAGPLVALAILGLVILAIVAAIMEILNVVELKRFEKELEHAKSTKTDNPLFIQANTEYKNPIYGT